MVLQQKGDGFYPDGLAKWNSRTRRREGVQAVKLVRLFHSFGADEYLHTLGLGRVWGESLVVSRMPWTLKAVVCFSVGTTPGGGSVFCIAFRCISLYVNSLSGGWRRCPA